MDSLQLQKLALNRSVELRSIFEKGRRLWQSVPQLALPSVEACPADIAGLLHPLQTAMLAPYRMCEGQLQELSVLNGLCSQSQHTHQLLHGPAEQSCSTVPPKPYDPSHVAGCARAVLLTFGPHLIVSPPPQTPIHPDRRVTPTDPADCVALRRAGRRRSTAV
ncbi:hypothetical protein MPH_07943 [Macrophomina phaseolina MS6]|uniref:Uncharacterized protein n=1 Tax=Macrophomina phaseolina (strain MS6) TaxID=1126212 RepID=K2RJS4_MACPH|nr:hypothetical protein MPH_07943 [Macrophomina phaseolina MS6]